MYGLGLICEKLNIEIMRRGVDRRAFVNRIVKM